MGYWLLVLLAFSLPFELTRRPFFSSEALVVNNLKIVQYAVAVLALICLARPFVGFVRDWRVGKPDPANYCYRQRVPLGLFAALLLACVLSSLLAKEGSMVGEGLKWTFQLLLGGLVWLGLDLWLEGQGEAKFKLLGLALVVGGVIAGIAGFFEFIGGDAFAESLVGWFKLKPTVAGPFLRLSGTFEYANIAAMYFELVLPFAMAGLVSRLAGSGQKKGLWIGGWALAIGVLLAALLLTLSRGAWFGLVIGLLAIGLITRGRGGWGWALGLTAGLGLLFGLVSMIFVPQFSLRLSSQSDQEWYKAAFQGLPPATMTVCQLLSIPVTVKNDGPLTWEATGAEPYNLSYHWLYPSGEVAQFEGIRTPLKRNVAPGQSEATLAEVRAPTRPGSYFLVWDMVQEEVSWFSLKSSVYSRLPVQVNDIGAEQRTAACGLTPTENALQSRPSPPELPQVLAQPGRDTLWKAALKMIAARPFLGVGPGDYRFNYGAFAEPPLAEWDNRVFANSLPLEIFADLGLVGGILYTALFAALAWPLGTAIWRKQSLAPWQIALAGALAAFLGHGLVDYVLASHAINILAWLLFGLAARRLTICD